MIRAPEPRRPEVLAPAGDRDPEHARLRRGARGRRGGDLDAVIVQDLGLAKLARAIAPSLPIHASTQMTCTDARRRAASRTSSSSTESQAEGRARIRGGRRA
jgi:hypothetical protein